MATISQGERGVRFSFKTDPPIEKLGFEIGRFAHELDSWTGLLRTFSPLFQRHMVETFETEGAAGGSRWASVGAEYAALKQATGHGSKIGVYSGALRSAMAGGSGYSVEVHGNSGSYGMTTSSKAIPYGQHFAEKRSVLRLSQRMVSDYTDLTKQWVFAAARKAGIGNQSLGSAISLGGGIASRSVLARATS